MIALAAGEGCRKGYIQALVHGSTAVLRQNQQKLWGVLVLRRKPVTRV